MLQFKSRERSLLCSHYLGPEGVLLNSGLYGEVLPKTGTFSRLEVYKKVEISRVEVYKKEGETVIKVFRRATDRLIYLSFLRGKSSEKFRRDVVSLL